jgi:ABC-2 type transport system ATP-binding protein
VTEPVLQARNLTKRYAARLALDRLTFSAGAGDIVGLLGPNGAGKTTAIRLLTTMLEPSGGEFAVAGIPGTHPDGIRRLIGVLPESAGYPGRQTATEFLRYHAMLFGRTRPDAAGVARELLAEVGLTDRAGSRVETYSRGMRQRLGIARALVNDPAVVFLDEPTLGLDPAGQRTVLDLLRDIAGRRGAAVLLSTHTLTEVEAVCSSVIILDRGRVVSSGSVAEVIRAASGKRSGQLQVPAASAGRAMDAARSVDGVLVHLNAERGDVLTIIATAGPESAPVQLNGALAAVLEAGVTVLSFEVDGARLADAFLALTGGPS